MSERWLLKKAAASDMTLAATWQRMKDLNCDRGSLGCILLNLLPQFQKFRGEHDLFVQPHCHVPGGVPHRRLSVGVGNDGLKPAARGLLYRYLNGLTNLLQILGKCDFLDLCGGLDLAPNLSTAPVVWRAATTCRACSTVTVRSSWRFSS